MDECVWYKEEVAFLCYMDDGIWISMKDSDIDAEIRLLQSKGLKIEDKGHPNDYVGVNIAKPNDGQYVFTQPFLIDAIINDVRIGTKQKKLVPMSAQKLLHYHLDSPPHTPCQFNYRSVVGKLNYLAQISQPDICYAIHQCAKYSSNPHAEHTEAIIYLAKYLNST